ncbi:permease of the major facilitator superfamily [Thozetella sp. PMI_491]|nr:permease of the major facilitator superfamily [Thozetella sp. PMI_491]
MKSLIKQTQPIRPPKSHRAGHKRPPNARYVYSLIAFVCLGSFLFGWNQGLSLMKPANDWSIGFVISIYNIGCAVGAMTIGFLADEYGRERTISLASVVLIAGALLQAGSHTIAQITVGRLILGLGIGAYSAAVPLYVSEICQASVRGNLGSISMLILCFAEMVVFFIVYGLYFLKSQDWWRIPLAIQVIPALILAVGCWTWVPPSPRWLMAQDRYECALEVLTRLHGSEVAEHEMHDIRASLEGERTTKQASWAGMFCGPALRVTTLGVVIQFLQQITGTCAIFYYMPQLFKTAGLDGAAANMATAGVGVVLFLSAWIPIFTFDKLGRKTWLQLGLIPMFLALMGIAIVQRHALRYPNDPANLSIVVFPYIFYIFFNMTWSPGSWLYVSEIFPISLRAKGNALCTASLWLSNFIVAQLTPPIVDAIGWGLYVGLAFWCIVAFVFVRYALVETRGRSLEEMAQLFGIDDSQEPDFERQDIEQQDFMPPVGFTAKRAKGQIDQSIKGKFLINLANR